MKNAPKANCDTCISRELCVIRAETCFGYNNPETFRGVFKNVCTEC